MTNAQANKQAKKFWDKYNRMAEQISENQAKMQGASREEQRRIIRENHEIRVAMDAMYN